MFDFEGSCGRISWGSCGGVVTERRLHAGSDVEHRPANAVPQPLIVEDELANRVRELVTLPLALESSRRLTLAIWR